MEQSLYGIEYEEAIEWTLFENVKSPILQSMIVCCEEAELKIL